ncbi:MAG TPA: N,N-dimethylformamidase beta subunit family domain-containing protein [Solirubrobacteraceae bacterium]|nr:N,N-dimethylformamidase beta subunit family domain-containing protein [Solirubrobacteraceae bacterium]
MKRLPLLSFAGLVAATVAAFFITQHLKVTTPLIAGSPRPSPAVINPLDGKVCGGLNHRLMKISFYLLHRSDVVDVFVVDSSGNIVATLATQRRMRKGVRIPDGQFTWNGFEDNGRIAPDGTYFIRVALINQGRTVTIADTSGPEPVRVKTAPPAPRVMSVTPRLVPQHGQRQVTIRYAGNENRGGTIRLFRTDLPGPPRLVKSFLTPWKGQTVRWDGLINRIPAPAGVYLVGLDVTDAACNTGHFPIVMPPPVGTTPGAGLTVRELAAQPPLDPVRAGDRAAVYVDSRQHPYRWTLTAAGARKPAASGRGSSFLLRVPLPRGRARLYALSLGSGQTRTTVPLVASAPRKMRALVVLPALSWQGLDPVDDDGDGTPDTLLNSSRLGLLRPLVDGPPVGYADEAALLAYLDSAHYPYDLTTDVGLIDGHGLTLSSHSAVILAGSEQWVPRSLAAALRAYVQAGGHVVSLGLGSLQRNVTVSGGFLADPTPPAPTDALGARPGRIIGTGGQLIAVISDQLGIFSTTSGVLAAFHTYQPITGVAPPGQILAQAGTSAGASAVVAYGLGRGTVLDIGLPGFGSALAHDVDAKELWNRLWTVLVG